MRGTNNEQVQRKARFPAQGDRMGANEYKNSDQTAAHTVDMTSMGLVICSIVVLRLKTWHVYIKSAFEHEIYPYRKPLPVSQTRILDYTLRNQSKRCEHIQEKFRETPIGWIFSPLRI